MFLLGSSSNKKAKDRVSQLSDIINTISSSRDMRGLLEATLSKALKALSSEKGSIFLTGDNGQDLFLRLAHNMNAGVDKVKKRLGEGVIGKVAEKREPILVKDIRYDSRFAISKLYYHYKTNSFLCVPIATDKKLIGVINITENTRKKAYTEKDLKFLKIIADHIALKIEKSQILSELESFQKDARANGKFVSLGKFAAGISHELNNPLDGIIRYVNLSLNLLEDGVTREYLLEARSGLKRITKIVRSLLELARRKNASRPQMIDPNETIENCIDLFRYQAMYRGIDIKKHLAPGLPRIPDLGLESVFSNILKNAVDALEEQGVISVSTCLKDGFIEIGFSDTGCGIHRDNMERIFEPFFTTKDVTRGSGLGLSICYDIVKRYNGKIDVVSEPDKGARFTIYLPCGGKK